MGECVIGGGLQCGLEKAREHGIWEGLEMNKPRKPGLIHMLFKCFITYLKRDALHKPSAFVSVLSILLKYCTCHYAQLNGGVYFSISRASLVVQMVKTLPAVQETRVQSLDGKDTLKKEMATHSHILAWSLVGYNPWGCKQSDTTE